MRVYRSPRRLYNALIRCEVLDPCFMVRCPCSCPCCFFPMPSGLSLVECLPVGPALAIPQFISFPVSAHPARSTWCCSSCLTGSHHDLFFFVGEGSDRTISGSPTCRLDLSSWSVPPQVTQIDYAVGDVEAGFRIGEELGCHFTFAFLLYCSSRGVSSFLSGGRH